MSTLPDSGSRTCASFFPAGLPATGVYLVGNQCSDCGRDPVTLSLSADGISFDRHFAVRHGVKGADIDHGGSCPRFKGAAKGCGYQYPGAMIDEARKEMIVSYSIGKERAIAAVARALGSKCLISEQRARVRSPTFVIGRRGDPPCLRGR